MIARASVWLLALRKMPSNVGCLLRIAPMQAHQISIAAFGYYHHR
jgi:hypothetical protein